MRMESKYLIVGGGLAADAAVRGIRSLDMDGSITLLSAESYPPYARPALSKDLWAGKSLDDSWKHTEQLGAQLRLGRRATGGDLQARCVIDDEGVEHGYEKLLLATGGAPRRLPLADPGVIYFRDLRDYGRTRELARQGGDFVVIGGGFIGSEMAAALNGCGCRVTLLFPERGIGAGLFPASLSSHLVDYYRERGVTVMPEQTVSSVVRSDGGLLVNTTGGARLPADGVVVGIGILPQVELALSLGLEVRDGIEVDEFLATSDPNVFAAGDVANVYRAEFRSRWRFEHENNAIAMGTLAGRNMAGQREAYVHLPYFYSDLFDHGYEAVGYLSDRLEIVEDWQEPYRKGTVYYSREGSVCGVLLWNTWDGLDTARALIRERASLARWQRKAQPREPQMAKPAVTAVNSGMQHAE